MTDQFGGDYARALWQSQASQVEHLSLDDIRRRAEYLRGQFDGSRWVPFAMSILLVLFFGVMLLAAAPTPANQAGAVIGLFGAFVPVGYMVLLHRQEPSRAALACVRAYQTQLARQRGALNASAITILMMTIGAGLLAVPPGAGPRAAVLSAAGPLLGGFATAW